MTEKTCTNCDYGQLNHPAPRCGLCAGPDGYLTQWKPAIAPASATIAPAIALQGYEKQFTVDTVTLLVTRYPDIATAYAHELLVEALPALAHFGYALLAPATQDKPDSDDPFTLFCWRLETSLDRFHDHLNKNNGVAIIALCDATMYASILSNTVNGRAQSNRYLKNAIVEKILR